MDNIVICLGKGGQKDLAATLANRLGAPLGDTFGEGLTVLFDSKGVSLNGYGLSYRGDFEGMLRRVSDGRLLHEMLARAAKSAGNGRTAVDATAGMGEDSFLLAACGYDVVLCEQNPVIAALLKDSLRRGAKNPALKEIIARMTLFEGNSIDYLNRLLDPVDLIYLDPMFPSRQKSGLINKKLQLIQKLEPPCTDETELFNAALANRPAKIVVKRPLKSPYLAGRTPNHSLTGESIRYDCYV